jgi:TolB-like protein
VDLEGEIDGRFKITGKLGAGGMGEVYRAHDERLRRDVALKVLPPAFARDVERFARFEHEARAAAALNHQNILALFDLGYHDGNPYLVTELLEGESLRQRLAAGALAVKEAVGIAVQLARGLAAAHAKGIVHRDLKPENVFVTLDGTVKILDFGLASLRGTQEDRPDVHDAPTQAELTQAGQVLGTIGYMAPEQVRGMKLDQRADIFAFGCVLYEMLAGRRAFSRDTAADTMSAILREEPTPVTEAVAGVSPALSQVVARCLEKRPEDRFSSAHDVALALQAAVSDTRTQVPSAVTVTKVRSRGRMVALAIAAACLIGAGAAFLWLHGRGVGRQAAPVGAPRVMVVPFENTTGDRSLDALSARVADAITQGLSELGQVAVAPAPRSVAPGDGAALKAAAERAGAGVVVAGSIYVAGDTVELRGRLTDVAQGTPIYVLEPETGSRLKPAAAIERTRQRAMSAVLMHLGRDLGLGGVTRPPLYSAYEEFLAGLAAIGIEDWPVTVQHFEKAAELDPGFWQPQICLFYGYLGTGETAKLASLRSRLRESQEAMGPAARLLREEYEARLDGEPLRALRKAEALLDLAPQDPTYVFSAAQLADNLNRPRDTLKSLGDLKRFDWNHFRRWTQAAGLITRAARAHHQLGEHEAELEVVRFGLTLYPDSFTLRQDEMRALAALGRVPEVEKAINAALSVRGRRSSPGEVILTAAQELRAHGYAADSRRIAAMGAKWYAGRTGQETTHPGNTLNEVECLWLAERYDEAWKVVESAIARWPTDLFAQGYRGIVAARLGKREIAEAVERRLATVQRRPATALWLRACITAQLDDQQGAVALLHDALANGFAIPGYLHVYAFLEPLHGYPPFEELIAPKG